MAHARLSGAELPIRCVCGALRGRLVGVSAVRGNHVVCYCDDCQAFAHFLGRAERILDARGGTEIFQTSPARLELGAGREQLACMRLTPNGLLRWYAGCCRTPLGNTLATAQIPFVGLILRCLDPALAASARAAALGPVRAHHDTRCARGEPPLRDSGTLRAVARFARLVLAARVRGDQRRSPFFDAATGNPTAVPRVLAAPERAALERARGA